MTDSNISIIRNQISLKKQSSPFYSTANYAESTVTDIDHFPYNRFYRGVYYSSDPVVFEREAGWRSTRNFCYKNLRCTSDLEAEIPNNCWQVACSTILPCYPPKQSSAFLNPTNTCINNYR